MSFPRYPAYKDSGVAWLGEIPDHWAISRTKNLFHLMKREPREDDEIVTAFRDGEVTLRNNRRVDGFTNAVHEHGYQRILPGDLVIHAMDAFAGAIGVSDSTGKSTPVYSVCTPKHVGVVAHYYGRLLRHMAVTGYINSLSKGIRERSTEFRWSEAAELPLAVPTPEEQTRIAAFLDRETAKIDRLVTEQQRLIDLLKEKRQAVISHAVTKGLNPAAPMKPSGIEWLGDVPAHWEIYRLSHVSDILAGHSFDASLFAAEGIPVIRMSDFGGGRVFLSDAKRVDEAFVPQRSLAHPGDILLGLSGSISNYAEVLGSDLPVAINQRVAMVRVSDDLRSCVKCFLQSGEFLNQIASVLPETTIQNVSMGQLRNCRIPIPPASERREIDINLQAATREIDALTAEAQRAIDLLQERRTALISAAVTGQIDVRHLAEAGAA